MSAGVGSRVAALEGTLCTWHDSCRRWRLGPPKPGVDVGPGAPAAEGVGLDAGGGPTVEGAGDQVLWATRVGRKARTRQRGGQVCVWGGGHNAVGYLSPGQWGPGPHGMEEEESPRGSLSFQLRRLSSRQSVLPSPTAPSSFLPSSLLSFPQPPPSPHRPPSNDSNYWCPRGSVAGRLGGQG